MSASTESQQRPSATYPLTTNAQPSTAVLAGPSSLPGSSSSSSSSSNSPRHLRVQPSLPTASHLSSVGMELDSDEKRADSDSSYHSHSRYHYDGAADGDASSASSAPSSSSQHNPSSSSSSAAASDRPPPRSILKRATSRKRSLRWDESNLAVNESEKVPRMKVDEPKTPYHAAHSVHSTSAPGSAGGSGGGGSFSQPHRSAFDQQFVDTVSTARHTLSSTALERRNEWEDESSGDDDDTTVQHTAHGAHEQPNTNTALTDSSGVQLADEEVVADGEQVASGEQKGDEQPDDTLQHEQQQPHSRHVHNGSELADSSEAQQWSDGTGSVVDGMAEDEGVRAKHARFEELRKQHYKMGAALKAHHVDM